MAKPSPEDVKCAIVKVMSKLTKANGFCMDLPEGHIYPNYDTEAEADKSDKLYPKCFVVFNKAKFKRLVSKQKERTFHFFIVLVIKPAKPVKPSSLMMKLVSDVEKLFDDNDTLINVVTDAQVTDAACDDGFAFPEGVAIFSLEAMVKL